MRIAALPAGTEGVRSGGRLCESPIVLEPLIPPKAFQHLAMGNQRTAEGGHYLVRYIEFFCHARHYLRYFRIMDMAHLWK